MKLKKLVAVLTSAVMVLSLTACGGSGEEQEKSADSSAASGDAVALRLWGAEEDQDLLKALVYQFEEEHSDVKFDIEIGVESEATAKDTILTDVEAAADVYAFASDQIHDLVNAGALANLEEYDEAFQTVSGKSLQDIKDANSEASVEAATVDGSMYAFPMSGDNSYFMLYDSSVVTEEDAKSWDTLLAAAEASGKKVGMVLASGWYNASFFYGAGFTTSRNEDGTTTMDWNGTSADGYTGVQVVQSMLNISANPAFMPIADGDTANQIASGDLCAIISGTWDVEAAQKAWGDGYSAAILPSFTVGSEQVQMAPAFGYKFVGVNSYSENIGWAAALAEYLTNEASQQNRFEARQIGPTNLTVAASDAVSENAAISTLIKESEHSVNQVVGQKYWDPTATFGENIAQGTIKVNDEAGIQSSLDQLVEGVTSSVE